MSQQLFEVSEAEGAAQHLVLLQIPNPKLSIGEDIPVAKISQVDEFSDDTMHERAVVDATVGQPPFEVPQIAKQRPVNTGFWS